MERFTSKIITTLQGKEAPEPGTLTGYSAIIEHLRLEVPLPAQTAIISQKHKRYNTDGWMVFSVKYQPDETIYDHLVFALKYEGINLLFFKKLFEKITKEEITGMIQKEYTGQYARKIWFLYEWLMNETLPIPDLNFKNFIPLINEKLQYALSNPVNSGRHRIKNNLPGTVNFCPLIRRTEKLDNYIMEDLSRKTESMFKDVHKDILQRTSAFLMLKDSKASFNIEGETPVQSRVVRWGNAIGQAGSHPLSEGELLRLQQIVIENSRFIEMGYRKEGGFVGEHDRISGDPIPEHISARWQDIKILMDGLIVTTKKLKESNFHPILTAAITAFGFVFIHPFVDGNGRIHRYLIHHILAKMNYTPQSIIFPVSAAMLEKIEEYKTVLENFSQPLLDFTDWRKTIDNNVEVLNETIDYYRYFDATLQAEFLFDCVDYTIRKIIPGEVTYLQKYDQIKAWIDDRFEMPDRMVSLLISFLWQNSGKLSKRAREKDFAKLSEDEIREIEEKFTEVMS